ncbi:MAG: subclass B3 metallo-beta-lactamase [Novosphingobium sp.]|nr:subclass B3 metallo-beta-lactamase [Novosphingobium sp.]
MFGKVAVSVLAAVLAGCVPAPLEPRLSRGVPPADLAAACKGKEGWDDPAPPARLHGSTYYVGTCGITALLVATERGHVLIDGGTEKGGDLVAGNIRALGLDPRDVRWILSTHEHFDHAGGLAGLQRMTGAKVAAVPAAAAVLRSGKAAADDPQSGVLPPIAPVKVARILRDGDTIRLGSLTMVAHATPGHAPGSTSWVWRSCDVEGCRDIAYVDSVTAISDKQYRFTEHHDYVAAFRRSLDRIAALPCDMLITPHPSASGLFERLAGGLAADDGACRRYAERGRAGLAARLAQESAAK